jgi:hypothetical protein
LSVNRKSLQVHLEIQCDRLAAQVPDSHDLSPIACRSNLSGSAAESQAVLPAQYFQGAR